MGCNHLIDMAPPTQTSSTMYWDSIIGQEKVLHLLTHSIDSGRVAHAYLFHGIDGTGKRAVALAFAHALQRKRSDKAQQGVRSAALVHASHPDTLVLIPEPSDADPMEVSYRTDLMVQNPYAAVDFIRAPTLNTKKKETKRLKQAFYSAERINLRLREQMLMRPMQGRYRIAIITDVDTIREQAANAFLKLLEEPAPDTMFILTTSRKDVLLPTILSRCQHVAFENLTPEVISKALQQREHIAAPEADLVSNIAHGSYLRALELTQSEELRRDRERVLIFLRTAFLGKIGQLTDLMQEMNQSSKDRLRNFLRLLLSWIHDLTLCRELGEHASIINHDQRQELFKFCHNLPNADLGAMAGLVEEALVLSESNVNPSLLMVNLSLGLGKAMRAPYSGKLFQPLTDF